MTAAAPRYPALYYDGRTARAHTVGVEIGRDGLSIFDANENLVTRWPAQTIARVEKPRRGEPVRLGREGTTERLVVEHGWVVAALAAAAPRAAGGGRLARRIVLRTSAWTVAAAGSVAVVVLVLIPLLSAQLAAITPEPIKQRIGEVALQRLAALVSYPDGGRPAEFCGHRDGLSALETLARRVTAGREPPPRLRLVVVRSDLVNAFALPGGYIVLTSGLLKAAESAEEAAGVLAHEVGHVAHDHATEALYRATAISMLVSVILGDVTFGVAGALTEFALNGRYSREAERAADRYAVELLNASGVDGRGLVRFFERMEGRAGGEDHPVLRILSTHPPTRARAEEARANVRADGIALDRRQWQRLRAVCGLIASEPQLVTLP